MSHQTTNGPLFVGCRFLRFGEINDVWVLVMAGTMQSLTQFYLVNLARKIKFSHSLSIPLLNLQLPNPTLSPSALLREEYIKITPSHHLSTYRLKSQNFTNKIIIRLVVILPALVVRFRIVMLFGGLRRLICLGFVVCDGLNFFLFFIFLSCMTYICYMLIEIYY